MANKPKVKMVIGKANIWSIGPNKKFTTEIPAATHTADQKFFTSTPLNTFAVRKTETLFINQAQNIVHQIC